MKKLHQLTKEINTLTLKIEQEYPELYKYLDETPITIPNSDQPDEFTLETFSDYLESLKDLLQSYIVTHKNMK